MISVHEAIQVIKRETSRLAPQTMALRDATGLVLVADVMAPIDLPVYNQSAMDGYAFRFDDWQQSNTLTITSEVAAGDHPGIQTKPFEAVRIFTGAAVPPDLDTVVMQEKTRADGNRLQVLDEQLRKG
ncbi:MAG TPA: molybdopterin molybdenumtransferase MoeA, partial [Flavisolibacter sp.]|nr:molybdopterin molybdenumtransferase MoeA [Flavisolibacter sp.]